MLSQVDDGEPLRKAALSCIDTILDNLPNRLDVGILMPYLAKVNRAGDEVDFFGNVDFVGYADVVYYADFVDFVGYAGYTVPALS